MKPAIYSGQTLKTLDSWRGVSAIVVFIGHCNQIFIYPHVGETGVLWDITRTLSNLSVVCFFLISGMMISYSCQNIAKNGRFCARTYLLNRATRIYPPLIFMISLVTLLYFLNLFVTGTPNIGILPHEAFATRGSFSFTFQNIIETIFMIPPGISQVNGALWSLYIEWWLYISFMFVFMALHSGTRGRYAYSALSLLPLILVWYFDGKFRIIFYFIVWWIGAFYTLFLKNRTRLMLHFRIVFYILLAIYLIWFGFDGALIHVVNWRIYGLFQVIVSFCIIDAVTRCSLGSLMVSAGKFSYSLYILHFPLLLFSFSIFHSYMTNPAIKVIVPISTCIAILVIACWSATFFENKKLFRDYFMAFVRRNA